MPSQKRKSICIDVDDTLADSTTKWIDIIRKDYGISLSISNITEYSLERLTGLPTTSILDAYRKVWSSYKEINPLNRNVPDIIDALGATYKIKIITASVGSTENIKSWLSLNKINYDSFTHYQSHKGKLTAKGDIYIDDNPEITIGYAKAGKEAIMIEQPWNKSYNVTRYGIKVAKDWDEVYRLLRKG
ncbi:MAG: 5' nucleotidase, NT5C type [Candidatus Micrarchaeia archaeon]